jgi:hypothetical protein
MNCEVCDANPVEWTLIPTGPEGLPQSIYTACLARFGLEAAKKVLPGEEIAAALGPMFVAPARAEALAKNSKRKGREEPEPTPEPTPDAGPTEGPPEESAAAANE